MASPHLIMTTTAGSISLLPAKRRMKRAKSGYSAILVQMDSKTSLQTWDWTRFHGKIREPSLPETTTATAQQIYWSRKTAVLQYSCATKEPRRTTGCASPSKG